MQPSECAVLDCRRGIKARGWCEMHYARWRRTGKVGDARPRIATDEPLLSRLGRYTLIGEGCWIWSGHFTPNGYGVMSWRGRTQAAHRLWYEAAVGPIPDGKQLHHRCFEKRCVNPQHLEPVTAAENLQMRRHCETCRCHE